jgi:hypothetical protein
MSHVVVEKPDGTVAFGRNLDITVPTIQEDEGEYMVLVHRDDRIDYHPICKALIHLCTISSIVKVYGSNRAVDLIIVILSFISSMCVHSNEAITLKILFLHSTYLIFYVPFVSIFGAWIDVAFYTVHATIILITLGTATITHYS